MEHTAIDKAIDVLFHLRAQPGPVGVTELGRALSLPKSSAHRLLRGLCRRELVEQVAGGGYRLGVGVVSLGLGALGQEPLVACARPVLEAHARRLGETFFLVAARGGRLVVLDKVEGTGFVRAAPELGATVPVHATAAGKLYLALDPDRIADAERGGACFTARTLDPDAFAAAVEGAARDGFAENQGEWIEGLSVWGAPVFAAGALAGVVATAMPSPRARGLERGDLAGRVLSAAADIGARLSGGAS